MAIGPVKRQYLRLREGGLMRCCTESLVKWIDSAPNQLAVPGEGIECIYEHKVTMLVNEAGDTVQRGAIIE